MHVSMYRADLAFVHTQEALKSPYHHRRPGRTSRLRSRHNLLQTGVTAFKEMEVYLEETTLDGITEYGGRMTSTENCDRYPTPG